MTKRLLPLLVLGVFSAAIYFLLPVIQEDASAEAAGEDLEASEQLIASDTVEQEPPKLYGISIE